MPIRPQHKWLYPFDWVELSKLVRFTRASGRCEFCSRPHGETIECVPDGRWLDEGTWRDRRGRAVRQPNIQSHTTRVILATCHLNHDPSDCRPRNLKALCQRCHIIHDRPEHLRRRAITYLLRRASGDLFTGPYPV